MQCTRRTLRCQSKTRNIQSLNNFSLLHFRLQTSCRIHFDACACSSYLKVVRIEFSDFRTSLEIDMLLIFDGSSDSNPLIAALSGLLSSTGNSRNSSVRTYTSTQGSMYVQFTARSWQTERGFKASYRKINIGTFL